MAASCKTYLRGTADSAWEVAYRNMSQRGAEMLRDELEFMPPQRRKAVEQAQSELVAVARRLDELRAITIARTASDEDQLV